MTASSDLTNWILSTATGDGDPLMLVDGVLKRLVAAGVPLWRFSLGMSTIDPVLRGLSLISWRDAPPSVDASTNDARGDAAFQQSPIFYAQSRGVRAHRWRLTEPADAGGLPVLERLHGQGASDYVLRLASFGDQRGGASGVAFSFSTDRPGGFADRDIALFDSLLPALALAGKCFSVTRTANEALGVYLGSRTSQRVLAGDIQRGKGQRISAAVLIADLRGFTALTDREDALRVVGWLDEHMELIGGAIEDHDGEVLKFLGDGLLAIFPFDGDPKSGEQACDKALLAAEQALLTNAVLNDARQQRGEPRLDLDVVLHVGEVVYGNVGAARRLDFTIIGSAVNEASRMEQHCQALRCSLLISDAFARLCSRQTVSVGEVTLRGLAGTRTVYAPLAPPTPPAPAAPMRS